MAQANNWYKADLRELFFVMFEQFKLDELLGKEPFQDWGVDEVKATLQEVYRFSTEVLGPLNGVGDREGVKLVDGGAVTPTGFKDAWFKLYETGFRHLGVVPEFGGTGAPGALTALANELQTGANTAFDMYPGLTNGAAELIEAFGTPEQRELYCPRMFSGQWAGTMCLTEPQAGSDVGAASTAAIKNADGSYAITGTKIFISGGDQDITENIVHMVLARTPGAPKGTKGLSLFIVPKRRVNADGSVAGGNDVALAALEHKMGINGSATAMLKFGEAGACVGYLLGEHELHGMKHMFQMMNYARIGVGLQSLGIASAAYHAALTYAKERKQGSSVEQWKDPEAPRVPVIRHPNVRRMLLDMKCRVDGIRALITKVTLHLDRAKIARSGGDAALADYHQGQLELLTPLVKSFASDNAFRVCELAIQVHGGVGYTRDFPVEQYARDAKIFSIYEGTNGIQALDLVGRKLSQRGGQNAQDFLGDVARFVAEHSSHPVLGAEVQALGRAQEAVMSSAMLFMSWAGDGQFLKVPMNASRFLTLMSETTIGWLLLDQAVIAIAAQSQLDREHPDYMFYEGKRHAATYWARQILPTVVGSAAILAAGDMSAWDCPDAAFATV